MQDRTATAWRRNPVFYEINSWVWLNELSASRARPLSLADVPGEEWDRLAALGVDAVWLMGVWERSPRGAQIAREHPSLQDEFRRALPDYSPEDVVGSPYCVRRYQVDRRLGGRAGLAAAREALARRGMRLILDFVPNHVAPDHPWVLQHPEYFVRGDEADLARAPGEYFEARGNVMACGRDPFFPPWTDTAQLNPFHPGLRRAATQTLAEIAEQCDGVRCDMAMLLLGDVVKRTWGDRAGAAPAGEYWEAVIEGVRARYPEFLLLAEVYWDREPDLLRQGFDYVYDKRLYDRLEAGDAAGVRSHLAADATYQQRLLRFLENHDEPRAAATFPGERGRGAAVALATLPGARLLHEGQLTGRRVKVPVQLGRRPAEAADGALGSFCRRLFVLAKDGALRDGDFRLLAPCGWPDNDTCRNLVAWSRGRGSDRYVVVVNLSSIRSQGRVRLPWDDLANRRWRLLEGVGEEVYERDGLELHDPGLFVDLAPWGHHLLRLEAQPS